MLGTAIVVIVLSAVVAAAFAFSQKDGINQRGRELRRESERLQKIKASQDARRRIHEIEMNLFWQQAAARLEAERKERE